MTSGTWSAACAEARAHFSEALDGDLPPAEGALLSRHLDGCAACAGAYAAYARQLGAVGPALHRLVDAETPRRPFPSAPERAPGRLFGIGWGRAMALAAASAAGILLGLSLSALRAPGGAEPERARAERRTAEGPHGGPTPESCPWKTASIHEVETTVSYPVVASECLDLDFELVEASVSHGRSCAENVRLTYRAGARSFVLEQHPGHSPEACAGERVLLDGIAGCFERAARGITSLRWAHQDQFFHLRGEVAPQEALAVARAIARDYPSGVPDPTSATP